MSNLNILTLLDNETKISKKEDINTILPTTKKVNNTLDKYVLIDTDQQTGAKNKFSNRQLGVECQRDSWPSNWEIDIRKQKIRMENKESICRSIAKNKGFTSEKGNYKLAGYSVGSSIYTSEGNIGNADIEGSRSDPLCYYDKSNEWIVYNNLSEYDTDCDYWRDKYCICERLEEGKLSPGEKDIPTATK